MSQINVEHPVNNNITVNSNEWHIPIIGNEHREANDKFGNVQMPTAQHTVDMNDSIGAISNFLAGSGGVPTNNTPPTPDVVRNGPPRDTSHHMPDNDVVIPPAVSSIVPRARPGSPEVARNSGKDNCVGAASPSVGSGDVMNSAVNGNSSVSILSDRYGDNRRRNTRNQESRSTDVHVTEERPSNTRVAGTETEAVTDNRNPPGWLA